MRLALKFKESADRLNLNFGEVYQISDGGFEKGYEAGVQSMQGILDGYNNEISLQNELLETAISEMNGKVDPELYEKGIVDGKKAEYDNFWDSFQDYGNRTNYGFAFQNQKHLANWFYPKYDIKPKQANNFMDGVIMYADNTTLFDLAERLKECGVKLDLSESTNNNYAFNHATISRIPELDLRKSTTHNNMLGRYIEAVDKLIFNGEVSWANAFVGASNLKNIVFEGTLKTTGLTLAWSNSLSKQSIESLFNCLATDTSGLTVTFSRQAVNKAFETTENSNNGSSSTEWQTLVGTKPNWNIVLA